jgi:hypothetical protein
MWKQKQSSLTDCRGEWNNQSEPMIESQLVLHMYDVTLQVRDAGKLTDAVDNNM